VVARAPHDIDWLRRICWLLLGLIVACLVVGAWGGRA